MPPRCLQGRISITSAIAGKVLKRLGSIGKPEADNSDFLTGREKEVLILMAAGLKNKQIANKLFVSVRTVEAHMGNIYSKLGVNSRTEAILAAMKKGWISLNELNQASNSLNKNSIQ
nr:response regulator transcription factor [Desulforamulus aquiferis]